MRPSRAFHRKLVFIPVVSLLFAPLCSQALFAQKSRGKQQTVGEAGDKLRLEVRDSAAAVRRLDAYLKQALVQAPQAAAELNGIHLLLAGEDGKGGLWGDLTDADRKLEESLKGIAQTPTSCEGAKLGAWEAVFAAEPVLRQALEDLKKRVLGFGEIHDAEAKLAPIEKQLGKKLFSWPAIKAKYALGQYRGRHKETLGSVKKRLHTALAAKVFAQVGSLAQHKLDSCPAVEDWSRLSDEAKIKLYGELVDDARDGDAQALEDLKRLYRLMEKNDYMPEADVKKHEALQFALRDGKYTFDGNKKRFWDAYDNWDSISNTERMEVLQEVGKLHSKIHGIDPVELKFEDLGNEGLRGYKQGNKIVINTQYLDEPDRFGTAAHENDHRYETLSMIADLYAEVESEQIKPGDPRYLASKLQEINNKLYFTMCNKDDKGDFIVNNCTLKNSCACVDRTQEGWMDYRLQPTEAHAHEYSRDSLDKDVNDVTKYLVDEYIKDRIPVVEKELEALRRQLQDNPRAHASTQKKLEEQIASLEAEIAAIEARIKAADGRQAASSAAEKAALEAQKADMDALVKKALEGMKFLQGSE